MNFPLVELGPPHGTGPVHVYAMVDLRTGRVLYVGATLNPHKRHNWLCRSSESAVRPWVIQNGIDPALIVIEQCEIEVSPERETHWIAYYAARGALLNRRRKGNLSRLSIPERRRVAAAKRDLIERRRLAWLEERASETRATERAESLGYRNCEITG